MTSSQEQMHEPAANMTTSSAPSLWLPSHSGIRCPSRQWTQTLSRSAFKTQLRSLHAIDSGAHSSTWYSNGDFYRLLLHIQIRKPLGNHFLITLADGGRAVEFFYLRCRSVCFRTSHQVKMEKTELYGSRRQKPLYSRNNNKIAHYYWPAYIQCRGSQYCFARWRL